VNSNQIQRRELIERKIAADNRKVSANPPNSAQAFLRGNGARQVPVAQIDLLKHPSYFQELVPIQMSCSQAP
jgi:hypothetical protein